jgi:hypothetical protein
MKFLLSVILVFIFCFTQAEEYFRIELEEISISGAPDIHSAAIVSYEGKWLVIGGRTNGLHGFNAIDPFSQSGINTNIYVINPADSSVHYTSAASLPVSVFEAVTTSNMQFYRHDSTLYMIGGYGWNDSAQTFLTAQTLTAINLKELIAAIENQQSNITPFFRQITDPRMAICGAHLEKIDSVYLLVFGHQFDGTYSRFDTSGLFVQHYSREIRKFKIDDDGINLGITDYFAIKDSLNFRRRDYNLVPQIFPDGSKGLTAFTGVFQQGINLPYLNTIDIRDTGYYINNSFNQNLSQYHCAVLPVYDSASNHMHTIFFGGMGMYYRDAISNTIVSDSLVPFVNTISKVTRDSVGNMTEYELAEKLPALLGTNAEFILSDSVPVFSDEIIALNQLPARQHVGYIYGGIESPEINISETDPSMSFAVNRIFKVFINKLPPDTTITTSEYLIKEPVAVKIFPNPFKDNFSIEIVNRFERNVQLTLYDYLMSEVNKPTVSNAALFRKNISLKNAESGIYFLEVKTERYKKYYRLIKI